jgi:hypothetical protein
MTTVSCFSGCALGRLPLGAQGSKSCPVSSVRRSVYPLLANRTAVRWGSSWMDAPHASNFPRQISRRTWIVAGLDRVRS